MSSLGRDFDELRERIKHGRDVGHASFEPVYYLVFSPAQILEVKRETPAWRARLLKDGWAVTEFSMAEHIADILRSHPLRTFWQTGDRKRPHDWEKTNKSLRQALTHEGALLERLRGVLQQLDGTRPPPILLVTDLEALHPYLRIGAIESLLQSEFKVPTVFLYPGTRSGKTSLRFLGFYPEDGNYRSVHVGG